MRCYKDLSTYEVNWKFINDAWVSAITVCAQNLDPQVTTSENKIYVFTNSEYVDWVEDAGSDSSHEANNVIATLRSQGFNLSMFTSIDFSSVTRLAGKRGMIIMPEMETNDLDPDLTSEARTRLSNWVNRGGCLVMFNPDEGSGIEVLNNVFSFSLGINDINDPISLTEAGASLSAFASAPSEIVVENATVSLNTDTLPVDSVIVYSGSGSNQSAVTLIRYGSGSIFIIGWDWYGAAPIGGEDGGWLDVLRKFVRSKMG